MRHFLSAGLCGVMLCVTLGGCASSKAPADPIAEISDDMKLKSEHTKAMDYDYSSLVLPELWILTKQPLDDDSSHMRGFKPAPLPWIQLDGLSFPMKTSRGALSYEQLISPLFVAINETLREYETFHFVPTVWTYGGPQQVGGVIYLEEGLTLQGKLLRMGLVRVDQRRINKPGQAATLNPVLVEHWLGLEEEARKNKRGFWKTYPQEMEQIGSVDAGTPSSIE